MISPLPPLFLWSMTNLFLNKLLMCGSAKTLRCPKLYLSTGLTLCCCSRNVIKICPSPMLWESKKNFSATPGTEIWMWQHLHQVAALFLASTDIGNGGDESAYKNSEAMIYLHDQVAVNSYPCSECLQKYVIEVEDVNTVYVLLWSKNMKY